MIGAGDLRETARLELPTYTQDDVGGKVEGTPEACGDVSVQIIPLTGQKLIFAKSVIETATHSVRMRYRSDVTNKHRLILADGTVFYINDVSDPDRKKRELHLVCSEVT